MDNYGFSETGAVFEPDVDESPLDVDESLFAGLSLDESLLEDDRAFESG